MGQWDLFADFADAFLLHCRKWYRQIVLLSFLPCLPRPYPCHMHGGGRARDSDKNWPNVFIASFSFQFRSIDISPIFSSKLKMCVYMLRFIFWQVCIPAGCVPPATWAYLQACTPHGGLLLGACLVLWGVCSRGRGVFPLGGLLFQHALRQTPLWTD